MVDLLNGVKTDREKKYASLIIAKGIPEPDIHKYGFAFYSKKVLTGDSTIL